MKRERFVIAASNGPYRAVAARFRAKGHRVTFIDDRRKLTRASLDGLRPAFVFFPHWSYIIPSDIYEKHECVIFHMTDLPYGRGGSPLQNLILRGHTRTRLSALKCGLVLDGGPVYAKRPLSLKGSAREIFERAAIVIESMIEDMLQRRPTPKPQKGRVVRFTRRTPVQSNLAGVRGVRKIYDVIRMLDADGYPRAFLEAGDLRYEFHSARLRGKVLEADVVITRREK